MQSIAFLSLTEDDLKALIREAVSQVIAESKPLPEPPPTEDLLTRNETAELLHVSLLTLRSYAKRGLLHPRQIGRRVLYRRSDVLAALNTARYGHRG